MFIPKPKAESSKKLAKRVIPEHVSMDVHGKQIAKKSYTIWMTYPDVKKLKDATLLYLTTSIKLYWTSVTPEMFQTDYIKQASSKSTRSTKILRYSCHMYEPNSADKKCNYSTSNSGQMGTHIFHCHLSICIKCKAFGMKPFHTCDMTQHLKYIHRDDAHVFYDQMPNLSGMQAEDVSGEMAECQI